MKKLLLAALVGVVIVEVVLLSRGGETFGGPALPLRRDVATSDAGDVPRPAPNAPRELELPRAPDATFAEWVVGARVRVDGVSEGAAVEPEFPTLTLDEAPPVPELPALEVAPLEFTVFEPPYDAHAIPAAVLTEALAASSARRAAIMEREGPDGEIASWLVDQPAEVMEHFLARATLDVGLEAWVHMGAEPGWPSIRHGRVLLYDPARGTLAPEVITLATRWAGNDLEDLPHVLGQADLDLDGRAELVVSEHAHAGTGDWRIYEHWFALGVDGRPRTAFRVATHSNMSWHGWPPGRFTSRTLPVSPRELWVEAWHEAEADGARVPLGHTLYTRSWVGAAFAPEYQVINADAPSEVGRGWTTESWSPASRGWDVKLALGTHATREVPAPLDTPALEIEPLAFTFFEPPYDEAAIPRAVLSDAREFCDEIVADLDEDAWYLQLPPAERERYLAVAEIHSGLQAWVHMPRNPIGTAPDLGRLLVFDARRGVLLPEHLTLETRWNHVHPTKLPEMLGRADLDLDGVPELAVREIDHNGTIQHDVYRHWFHVDPARGLRHGFVSQEFARGWFEPRIEGDIHARLIPLSATRLRAEAWFEPYAEYDAAPRSLGHTLFARPDLESAWRLVDEVHDPWAPSTRQQGFASFDVSRLGGWRVRVVRDADADAR